MKTTTKAPATKPKASAADAAKAKDEAKANVAANKQARAAELDRPVSAGRGSTGQGQVFRQGSQNAIVTDTTKDGIATKGIDPETGKNADLRKDARGDRIGGDTEETANEAAKNRAANAAAHRADETEKANKSRLDKLEARVDAIEKAEAKKNTYAGSTEDLGRVPGFAAT